MRALNADVFCAAIRAPDPSDLIGPEEQAAYAETFYVLKRAGNPFALAGDQVAVFAAAPVRWLRSLGLALTTGRPGVKGTLWQVFYFLEAGVLARRFAKEGITHLHNHFADASSNVAMLTSALSGIPFSFTLHGPAELYEPRGWHLGEKIARAAFTVCISHFARSQAMYFSDPAHWHKLKIVHCGVSPETYQSAVNRNRKKGELRLLFVGRLTAIKGLRVLFEAMHRLRGAHPGVSLSIIGDGEDRDWAETEAAKLGGIELLGFQSQSAVADALAQADAFVLPSFAEGVPVALMEAMAAGKPVIATQVGGVSELVENGVSGFVLAPGDAAALAEAIADLADSGPEALEAMGRAGRDRVRRDFDVGVEADRILALFNGQYGKGARPERSSTLT